MTPPSTSWGTLSTVYNNTIGKIPGVAEIDMQRVRASLEGVRAKAADDLNPALEDTKGAMDDTAASTRDLSAAAGELEEKASTTAERVREWKEAQVEADRAGGDLEAQVRGQVIPTLDELIASMEETEEATDEVTTATRDLTDEVINFSEEGSEALTEAELSQGRSYANIQEKAERSAEAQKLAAEEIAEAVAEAADATQRETDRINGSWDGFIVKQDAVVAAMNTNSISFEDVVTGLAQSFGISTTDMALKAAAMGVSYNDTMALMEAFGREKISAIVGQINAAAGAAESANRIIQSVRPPGRSGMGVGPGQGGPEDDIARAIAIAEAGGTVGNFQVPETASGGITNGSQIRRVGEEGREAIIPLSKLPDMLSRMMGGGTGGRPPITVMGDVYGYDDFVDKVGQAGVELEERGG